jgi:hypothetical protein
VAGDRGFESGSLRRTGTAHVNRGKRFRVGPCLRLGLAVARQASLSRGLAEVSAISAEAGPVGEGQGDGVFSKASICPVHSDCQAASRARQVNGTLGARHLCNPE